jgi:phosphotransferase system, enzyme I, PtsP
MSSRSPATAAHQVMMNAGLRDDMPLGLTGADGIGLFRTEFQFLVSATLPQRERQTRLYRDVLDAAGDKPVMFRTVDIGGDKSVPYLRQRDRREDENPAMGWRALRLALEREGLMKVQARALLEAAAGRTLNVMFPMVSEPWEFDAAKAVFDGQLAFLRSRRSCCPTRSLRRDARSAGAGRSARRAAAEALVPVDRHQRPHAVPVRRRPRQSQAGRTL